MLSSGFITRKVENKKRLLLTVCVVIILSLLVFVACLHSYNKIISFCGFFLLGLFLHSFWPMSSVILLKIAQPVSEIYSFGFGQMLGSVQVLVNGLIFARIFQLSTNFSIPFTFCYLVLAYSVASICFSFIQMVEAENEHAQKELENVVKDKKDAIELRINQLRNLNGPI